MDARIKGARLSIFSNSCLVLAKLSIGILTQSVSIISEAIHSGMDLLAALICFFSVREAAKPADSQHAYGHGKIENLSGSLEAALVFGAAAWIILEAIEKLRVGGGPAGLVGLGIFVMLGSAGVNWIVAGILQKTAHATESVALEGDALHLRTDVYTSLGVAGGLFLFWVTKLSFLDPLVALGVAALILKEASLIFRKSFLPLLDVSLSPKEEAAIAEIISRYAGEYVEFHKLRTRRSGAERHVDLHLIVPKKDSVSRAHQLCEEIEAQIKDFFPTSQVLIHVEPCAENCKDCQFKKLC